MTFKEFINELNGKKVEGELVKTIIYSILTSAVFFLILYFIKFNQISNFLPKYGLPLFLSALSFAIVVPAMRQVRAYGEMACMPGMMIGMTFGMVASFLPGFYVASTNGMFIGGLFGIAVGLVLGIWTGSSSGIMGIMEGIMAAFMGGLMGAMTAFMLLNDHLKAAGIIVFVICAVIMAGLNYMIYQETKSMERKRREDHFFTILLTFILIALTAWLIVFGPRSALFA